jgi:predicted ester cyclase
MKVAQAMVIRGESTQRRNNMTQTLSTEDRISVAREYVKQVFVGHDAERARDFFTADVVWHGNTLGTVNGLDTIVPILAGFIDALTDIHAEVQDVIASNDLVALRQVLTARHTGNLLGIPATNGPVHWDAVDIYRVNDAGKISEQWAFEDLAAVLNQIGGVKLPWAWS